MIDRRSTKGGTRYEVRLRGPDGKERSKTCHTRREAEKYEYERQQRTALEKGPWIDLRHASLTLRDYAKRWRDERHDLGPSTFDLYDSRSFGCTASPHLVPFP